MPTNSGLTTGVGAGKKKIFHGWYIVGLGFIAHLAHAASISSTLGVFFKPMSEEFGWPRSFLSGVRSFEGILSGLLIALVGSTLDRHGARTVMVAGGIIGGIGLFSLGLINDTLQFLVVRLIVVTIGMAGISHMVSSVALSNWFVRKRGRVLGISGSGAGAGKIILAPLVTLLMTVWDWRAAWMVLGLAVLVLIPLPAALFVRRRPEDMGLFPDGEDAPSERPRSIAAGMAHHDGPLAGEVVWTRGEAVRTSAFWLIILTFAVATVGFQGWALHMIPYLTDIGFSAGLAAAELSILAVFQMVGTLGWGFIVERFQMRYCAVAMFFFQASGVAITLWLHAPAYIAIGFGIYGFGLAGNSVLQDIVWANYFGRLSLGTIRGIGMPLLTLSSSIGPLYFGYLYDVTGGYESSLIGFMAALITAAGLVLACRPPRKQPRLEEPKLG